MSYRVTKVPDITEESILENARRWLNIIRYSEYGLVIQPQDDCEYRVDQIIHNPKILKDTLGPYHRRYLLGYVPIDDKNLLETIKEAVLELASSRKIVVPDTYTTAKEIITYVVGKGYEIGLFISRINKLLTEHEYKSLLELEYLLENALNFSVIVFSEQDLTHSRFKSLVDKCSLLFDHVSKFPFYHEKDSRQYIAYNNSMWSMKLPKHIEDKIVESCGGYLWLISHLQRFFRDDPGATFEKALEDESLILKLESIYWKFTEKEQELILKTAENLLSATDRQTHEFHYLSDIRMIQDEKGQARLGIPLISLIIQKEKSMRNIELKDGKVVVAGKDVEGFLTKKEIEMLRLLLSNPRKVILRDDLAPVLWGENWDKKYSDWAIDKLAFRVRKKISRLGIDEKLLKTVKRKGFTFG